jgi:MFS transporter, OFA family, oxalate/formate antiporter
LKQINNRQGWIVTLSGMGVNLMLGTLYAWGVISAALIDQLGWTATETQIPYMVACAIFALSMAPGGRIQDMFGPRPVLTASAILAGIGFILSGLHTTVISLMVFFGIIFGLSMGMGYAAPTPAAVKWFEPSKRGLISGIVVSGFGLAPVYIAPITTYLLEKYGIQTTFFTLGAGFFTGILMLSRFITNPSTQYINKINSSKNTNNENPGKINLKIDYNWHEVIKTKEFYKIWAMFCFGTFAGLLIIGQLSKIGLEQAGITNGFLLIAIYAIFNALGRIGCGIISDKIGRMKTLFIMFIIQVIVYLVFPWLVSMITLSAGVALVGFTFGGMLTLFPATTADYFGLKNFGVNFGLVITAWGIGGVFGPLLGGLVRDATGTYTISYIVSAVLSGLGALLSLVTKPPKNT